MRAYAAAHFGYSEILGVRYSDLAATAFLQSEYTGAIAQLRFGRKRLVREPQRNERRASVEVAFLGDDDCAGWNS